VALTWDRNQRFSAEDLCNHQKGGLVGILKISREITPRVVLHVSRTIHMSQTVKVLKDHGFRHVEIDYVSVEGWKNSLNAVLYLEMLSEGGGVIKPTVSKVLLNLGSNATETICIIACLISRRWKTL
jgi:hypothetical protein